MLGDKRYNDKISDFSPQAVLDGVERDKTSTKRIMAIDPAGFTSQEMISRELFIEQTSQEVESLEFKEWGDAGQSDGRLPQYVPTTRRTTEFQHG